MPRHLTIPKAFADLHAPRVARTRDHIWLDMLFVALCALLCGANSFCAMEIWARAKEPWLREHLALPQILASATALAPGLPIRLGLVSVGMRTNSYGPGVLPNPERAKKPMAQGDPRKTTEFAADYARAASQLAAEAGGEALALAAPAGPFAATGALRAFVGEADV